MLNFGKINLQWHSYPDSYPAKCYLTKRKFLWHIKYTKIYFRYYIKKQEIFKKFKGKIILKERLIEIKSWLKNLTWDLFIVFEKIYIVFIRLIKKFMSYRYTTTKTQTHSYENNSFEENICYICSLNWTFGKLCCLYMYMGDANSLN